MVCQEGLRSMSEEGTSRTRMEVDVHSRNRTTNNLLPRHKEHGRRMARNKTRRTEVMM